MSPGFKALAGVLLATVLVGGGYKAGVSREQDRAAAVLARVQAEQATTLGRIAALTATAAEKAAAVARSWGDTVAEIDNRYFKDRKNDLAENERLALAVADGTRRLRLAGTRCPTGGSDVPPAAGASRVDDGAGVELSAEAGRTVLNLRADLLEDRRKIAGLQDYVRQVCSP